MHYSFTTACRPWHDPRVSESSVIEGDRSRPSGYTHPHASEEARRIAEAGMTLRVQVGSGVHGISMDGGNDDRDEMGICVENVLRL